MSIFATNRSQLSVFNDLLHDLYTEIPMNGFVVSDGIMILDFFDRESGAADVNESAHYQLAVRSVEKVDATIEWARLPGNEAQLDEIEYDERILRFKFVHPIRLTCRVFRLELALDAVRTEIQ